MTRRTQRVNELLRQEISLVLQQKLSDPRLGSLISVTRVETAEDFQQAKVYVSVLGAKEKRDKAIQGLTAATGYLRRELGDVLSLKRIPHLMFVLDSSLDRVEAVDRILNDISIEEITSVKAQQAEEGTE